MQIQWELSVESDSWDDKSVVDADVCQTGDGPDEAICLGSRNRTLQFHTWMSYFRYDIFRSILKGATSTHLVLNPSVIDLVVTQPQSIGFHSSEIVSGIGKWMGHGWDSDGTWMGCCL